MKSTFKEGTGSFYGSVNGVVYGEDNVRREEQQPQPHHKVSIVTLILGGMAIVTAMFLIQMRASNQPAASEVSPLKNNIETMGEARARRPQDVPHFFDQVVDHLDKTNNAKWRHRYYKKLEYFKGPGHPIFLVVGGEDGNDWGMFYSFIEFTLAEKFGAFVIHPEHRFYGISQPIEPAKATNDDLKKLHTARQAMLDMLNLVQHYQKELGCSLEKNSKDYCPVISVGGSYPGFLSAVLRTHYPDIVDIGYASSAPLKLYAMEADQFGYFDVVTQTAEKASPGCEAAVRKTLLEVDEALKTTPDYIDFAHRHLNICHGSIPDYVNSGKTLSEELMQVVGTLFADFNMFNYPPTKDTDLALLCSEVFQDESFDSYGKMAEVWKRLEENIDLSIGCFEMKAQLPEGQHATLSGSDWSGIGTGYDGEMFDFHCCSTLTPAVGFSQESMFPYRPWTLEWLTEHCLERFDVVPDPMKLVDEFKFNDLVGQGASRILFTNGMNDLWHVGSYLEPLSDSILAITMPNGAHHSELRYTNEDGMDTEDVMKAHDDIADILEGWLDEIKAEQQ